MVFSIVAEHRFKLYQFLTSYIDEIEQALLTSQFPHALLPWIQFIEHKILSAGLFDEHNQLAAFSLVKITILVSSVLFELFAFILLHFSILFVCNRQFV